MYSLFANLQDFLALKNVLIIIRIGDFMYLTIKNSGENELIINKSRFICHISRANTKEEAEEFIKTIRKKHYNATHNCYAYIIGKDRLLQKANDDGEPSGTAGIPMLEVLRKNNLTDIVCVVTRYFGGIKLGAGGLIRAYSNSVSEAIKVVGIVQIKTMQKIIVELEYAQIGLFDHKLSNYQVINKEYTEKVKYTYLVDIDNVDNFINYIIELTNDKISYQITEQELCEVDFNF